MASISKKQNRIAPAWYVFWALFLAACLGFLYDSTTSIAEPEIQQGATFWNRMVWYFAHAAIASPILLIAPLQFMPGLRLSRPAVHRWLGRIFLASSMVAGLLGIWLGATISYTGSRIPLTLLGSLWFCFAAVAWQAARRQDFPNHRRFAIRTFALGAAFVWVRIISQFQADILGFIPVEDTQETTKEWLTLLLPILVTEIWLNWGPTARKLFARTA